MALPFLNKVLDPVVKRCLELLDDRLAVQTDSKESEFVSVTFSLGANTDHQVPTKLRPFDPESVRYQVVATDRATTIYNDESATRTPWSEGFVILRSSTANAVVRLRLFIERS